MDTYGTSQKVLEDAALAVIGFLKTMPDFSASKIAVIGGMAVVNYLPATANRTTLDVDFIINTTNAPKDVKDKLLGLKENIDDNGEVGKYFTQNADIFYYRVPGGPNIQVDITAQYMSPYLPVAAKVIRDIPDNFVPYITPEDVVVFKIMCCPKRFMMVQKTKDALDAQRILETNGSLSFSKEQRDMVTPYLEEVAGYTARLPTWWQLRLGLPTSK